MIGIQDGSSGGRRGAEATRWPPPLARLKQFGDNVTALMDPPTGRLDAVVLDEVVGRLIHRQNRTATWCLTTTSALRNTASAPARTTPRRWLLQKAMDEMK